MLDLSFLKNSCPFCYYYPVIFFPQVDLKQIKQGNAYFRNSVIIQPNLFNSVFATKLFRICPPCIRLMFSFAIDCQNDCMNIKSVSNYKN